jgi:hypothetical protein
MYRSIAEKWSNRLPVPLLPAISSPSYIQGMLLSPQTPANFYWFQGKPLGALAFCLPIGKWQNQETFAERGDSQRVVLRRKGLSTDGNVRTALPLEIQKNGAPVKVKSVRTQKAILVDITNVSYGSSAKLAFSVMRLLLHQGVSNSFEGGIWSPRAESNMTRSILWVLLFLVFLAGVPAHGDAALLLEEPYGTFGELNPTGHAAVYLSRVCAVTPTTLRRCYPGETGIVISRYYKIAGYDWIAIPVTAYFYAVDEPSQVPEFANAEQVSELRNLYRRRFLETIAPDASNGEVPGGEWTLLVGQAYDRKIYGFQIETSTEQDDELIRMLNQHSNHRSRLEAATFLLSHNCADFARGILNFYYPHSVRRNFLADLGITTPKQVAKSLVKYARSHSNLEFSSFVIPQVPGSRHHSQSVDGVAEALVKSKKYLVPLAFLHPFVTASVALLYLGEGRFNPSSQVQRFPESPEIAALREGWHEGFSLTPARNSYKERQIPQSAQ